MTTIHTSHGVSLGDLFSADPPPNPYRDLAAELSAVREGRKSMSVFSFPEISVTDGDEEYLDLVSAIMGANLCVSIVRDAEAREVSRPHVEIFAFRENEGWRVPAYLLLMKVLFRKRWTDELEYMQSQLLGYTDSEFEQWMHYQRAVSPSWRGRVVYLLVDPDLRDSVVADGALVFPSGVAGEQDVLCFYDGCQRPVFGEAAVRLPRAVSLARVAVTDEALARLFVDRSDRGDDGIVARRVAVASLSTLNRSLRSKIQFLSSDGWH